MTRQKGIPNRRPTDPDPPKRRGKGRNAPSVEEPPSGPEPAGHVKSADRRVAANWFERDLWEQDMHHARHSKRLPTLDDLEIAEEM